MMYINSIKGVIMECDEIHKRLNKLRKLTTDHVAINEINMWMEWATLGEIYNAKTQYAVYKNWGQIMFDANKIYKQILRRG